MLLPKTCINLPRTRSHISQMTNHPFHRHSGGKRHGSCIYVDLVSWCVQSLQTPCSHWWKITLYLVIQAFILLFLDINIQQNVAFTLIDTSKHILIDLCSLDHRKAHELYIQSNGEGKLWAFFSLFFWEEHYLYQYFKISRLLKNKCWRKPFS